MKAIHQSEDEMLFIEKLLRELSADMKQTRLNLKFKLKNEDQAKITFKHISECVLDSYRDVLEERSNRENKRAEKSSTDRNSIAFYSKQHGCHKCGSIFHT